MCHLANNQTETHNVKFLPQDHSVKMNQRQATDLELDFICQKFDRLESQRYTTKLLDLAKEMIVLLLGVVAHVCNPST